MVLSLAMTTRQSNTSAVVRGGASALNWYLLYKIWRKYGKGAFALGFALTFSEALYHSWPQVEAAWKTGREMKIARERIGLLTNDPDWGPLLSELHSRQSPDPLSRLFIRPEDQEQ